MVAVDTNVVVRFLMRDDPRQSERARALFNDGPVFLSKTVALETEWVLRSLYGLPAAAIADGMTRLLGMENVECEDEAAVTQAMDWCRAGIDFADALHLASSRVAGAFATFDTALARRARRLIGMPVSIP